MQGLRAPKRINPISLSFSLSSHGKHTAGGERGAHQTAGRPDRDKYPRAAAQRSDRRAALPPKRPHAGRAETATRGGRVPRGPPGSGRKRPRAGFTPRRAKGGEERRRRQAATGGSEDPGTGARREHPPGGTRQARRDAPTQPPGGGKKGAQGARPGRAARDGKGAGRGAQAPGRTAAIAQAEEARLAQPQRREG